MDDEIIDALAATELFGGLSRRQLALIARVTKRHELSPGTVLIEEGQNMTHMAVIARGEATITVAGAQVGTVGPTDVIGELSLIDEAPATATASFPDGGSVWMVSRIGFIPVWDKNRAEISTAMLLAVTKKLRATNQRIAE